MTTDGEELKALFDDVRDALNVTCDVKGRRSLASLKEIVSRIKEERDRLRKENEDLKMLGKCVEGGMPIVSRYTLAYQDLEAERDELDARLRYVTREWNLSLETIASQMAELSRLRFISGGALKEGATQ